MLQVDLEDLIYASVISAGTAGAFYRLLKRSRAQARQRPMRCIHSASERLLFRKKQQTRREGIR